MIVDPFVSCIMPTSDRRAFISQAIRQFQYQTYQNMELIVVDDGAETVEHMIPDDPRIQYVQLSEKLVTGAKRNYACSVSKGGIIVHLDDDDWYAKDWVEYQVRSLTNSTAEICGLSELYFSYPQIAKAWKYVYPAGQKPWIAGATMAYYRTFWERNNFQNIKIGEDNIFAWAAGNNILSHQYINGMVATIHPGNTSPKSVNNSRWKPVPFDLVKEIMKEA
jgi:glycosyltransferase involved in cell wall biosynthesis